MSKKKRKGIQPKKTSQTSPVRGKMLRRVSAANVSKGNDWERYLDKTLYYGMLVLAIYLPLIFERFTYDQFDLPKMVFLRTVVIFLLAVFFIKLLLSRKTDIQLSPIYFLAAAFVLSVLISTLLSVHPPTALFGKYRRYEGLLTFTTYGILFFLTIQVFRDFSRIRSLAEVMVISAAIASFYGILQFFGLDPFEWAEVPFELRRSFSTYGNPTLLAGYLVIAFPLSLAIFFSTKERWEAIAYGVFSFMVFFCLLTSFTRASWLGMAAQVVVAAFLYPFAYSLINGSLVGKARRIIVFFYLAAALFLISLIVVLFFRLLGQLNFFGLSANTIAVALLVLLALAQLPPFLYLLVMQQRGVGQRVLAISVISLLLAVGFNYYSMQTSKSPMNLLERATSATQVEAGSAGSRVEIWKAAVKMVKTRPIFGFGPDTFRLVSRIYQTKLYAHISQFTVADNAHNYLLQIASGNGIAGLALFLLLMISFLVAGGFLLKGTTENGKFLLYAALIVSLIGYLVHLIFSVSVVGGSTFLWLIFGVIVAQSPFVRSVSFSPDPSSLWIRGLLAIIITVFSLAGVKATLELYYADVYFVAASRYTQAGLLDQAVQAYKTAASLHPSMDRYQAELASLYLRAYQQTGDDKYLDQAIDWFKRANRTSPLETDNLVFLANAYMIRAQKDPKYYQQAIKAAKESVKIAPYLANGHLLLGICYLETNELDSAIKELKIAVDLNPESADGFAALGQAYERQGKNDLALKSYKAALKINPELGKAKEGFERLKTK